MSEITQYTLRICLDDRFSYPYEKTKNGHTKSFIDNYYQYKIDEMNKEHYLENKFRDSGFDLIIPKKNDTNADKYSFDHKETKMIDLGVKCELINNQTQKFESYYLYPRSSISKTPFRLANCVGIIDSGYRGNLKVVIDNKDDNKHNLLCGHRLFQICMPNLTSDFKVEIVDKLTDTSRGSGGFGSTGQ